MSPQPLLLPPSLALLLPLFPLATTLVPHHPPLLTSPPALSQAQQMITRIRQPSFIVPLGYNTSLQFLPDFLNKYEELADGFGLTEEQKFETILPYVLSSLQSLWKMLRGCQA